MFTAILNEALQGKTNAIARCISLIENEVEGYEQILINLPVTKVPIIGITGPPGAGKSTLTDQLINLLINDGKKVAVLCIDPSSPFHHGALLGDRVRMSRWYNNDNVFIRSLASKAILGGLSPKAIEISDLLKALNFDYVIIETIGVGQNEIEIASIADVTMVVLVPEGGDEIQTMKAGLIEVADIFIVNKCDRPGADTFIKFLKNSLSYSSNSTIILKTIATKNEGIKEVFDAIKLKYLHQKQHQVEIIAERLYTLLSKKRMRDIKKTQLEKEIKVLRENGEFNFYKFLNNLD
jgi:LAO/AO transport system kinase